MESAWRDRQRRALERKLEELDVNTIFMHIDIEKNYLKELSNKINIYNNN